MDMPVEVKLKTQSSDAASEIQPQTTQKPPLIEIIKIQNLPLTAGWDKSEPFTNVGSLLELRDHPKLKHFLPDFGRISITLLQLKPNQNLPTYTSPTRSLLFIYEGDGELIGDHYAKVANGDTLAINPGIHFGLLAGSKGLRAFNIRFGERRLQELLHKREQELPNTSLSYTDVIKANERLYAKFQQHPFFTLAQSEELKNNLKKRKLFLNCILNFSKHFQKAMFSRQASCDDERYEGIFMEHMIEEFKHDIILKKALHEVKLEENSLSDPILEAVGSWFVYKMSTLDNIGKTLLMHLVLETSGDYFFNLTKDSFDDLKPVDYYFKLHAELDEDHQHMGDALLKDQHPTTYKRMISLLEQSWAVMTSMIDRVVFLVHQV